LTENKSKNIAFYTFGCKLNFSETSFISNKLKSQGYGIVHFNEPADYYVINNCTVTREAERKFERLVRSVKSKHPAAKIIAMGCFSEVSADDLSMNPMIDLVLGTNQKFGLAEYISQIESGKLAGTEHTFAGDKTGFENSYSKGDRTRSFLKVQDGCDYFCSYCAIPHARGRSRSDSVSGIIRSVHEITDEGIREIVLTGVNVGEYKSPEGETLTDLIQEISKIDKKIRIRISSLEPNLIGDELLELISADKKFMPHFHIPLQSGSDRILRLMNRKYTSAVFKERILKILEVIPDVFIGIDVIAGFPGETDDDFQETYNLLAGLEIAYLHVFPYSERPGTRASAFAEKNDPAVISKRTHTLIDLSDRKNTAFNDKFIGREREVLFEGMKKDGMYFGHTDNYLKVKTLSTVNISNVIKTVELVKLMPGNILLGQII
jgi:threonylcarbamoyladenosine tRNA methylthiotransferase MtaB